MVINFFASGSNLNKLSSMIGFNNQSDLSVLNSFIGLGIIMGFAIALLIAIFIYKIIKIIIYAGENNTRELIVGAMIEFGKSIIIMLVFGVCFNLFFAAFDLLARSMDGAFNEIGNQLKNPIEAIPGTIYQLITNEPWDRNNIYFLFPSDDLLTKMNSINWLISILFVGSFAFFMIWIIWSIFQKMIEIFFLYLSFPISVAFGQETNQIHWRIWVKEIINKVALIFLLMLFLRLFLYMFYYIVQYAVINNNRWTKDTSGAKLYISFFISLALGSSMMFLIRLCSVKTKEHIGILGSVKSYRQTRNFITNNEIKNFNTSTNNQLSLEPINEHIDSLKHEISSFNNAMQTNYENLAKVKVFDK